MYIFVQCFTTFDREGKLIRLILFFCSNMEDQWNCKMKAKRARTQKQVYWRSAMSYLRN